MIDEKLYKTAGDSRHTIGKALAILHGNGHKDLKICEAIEQATKAHNTLLGIISEYLENKKMC